MLENTLTNPGPVQVDGDKGGWDGEVVHEGVKLQHEPELVRSRDEADEEVDHEEDVEGKINLLEPVFTPGYTLLHSLVAWCVYEVDSQRRDGQDEDQGDLEITFLNFHSPIDTVSEF